MPALQTQSKGWPSAQWHNCRFVLPLSDSYSVTTSKQISIHQFQCHVQLQFVSVKGQNLTEQFCLNQKTVLDGPAMLKLVIKSYATMDLIELVRDYQLKLAFKEGQRVVRHSGDPCSNDLVNLEEGFSAGVVNYNDHAGDCVAKLHLPYGYATLLRFEIISTDQDRDETETFAAGGNVRQGLILRLG